MERVRLGAFNAVDADVAARIAALREQLTLPGVSSRPASDATAPNTPAVLTKPTAPMAASISRGSRNPSSQDEEEEWEGEGELGILVEDEHEGLGAEPSE